jgi:hypothetical protein
VNLNETLQQALELPRVVAQFQGSALQEPLVRIEAVLAGVLARATLALCRARAAGAPGGWRWAMGDGLVTWLAFESSMSVSFL